jgi:mannosyl-3-phosphoglycerate phosphatase
MSGAVIYTDLDGTLLDHHTYSAEAASATLSKLRELGIPVIPCTSKTVAETRPIAAQLRLDGPNDCRERRRRLDTKKLEFVLHRVLCQ